MSVKDLEGEMQQGICEITGGLALAELRHGDGTGWHEVVSGQGHLSLDYIQ